MFFTKHENVKSKCELIRQVLMLKIKIEKYLHLSRKISKKIDAKKERLKQILELKKNNYGTRELRVE